MELNSKNKEDSIEKEKSVQLLNNFQLISFKNEIEENNCFVSVVIHSFFHFPDFKNYLINFQIKDNTPKLFIELIELLTYNQNMNKEDKKHKKNILTLNSFRNELAIIFQNKKEFQLNQQGDPIELLNFLLNYIHNIINSKENKDDNNNKLCEKDCIIHKLFFINLNEITKCNNCKDKTILNYDENYFLQLLNINLILENIKELINFTNIKENLFLYTKYGIQFQKCIKCKKNSIEKSYDCKSIGKYFIINLSWNGNSSKMEDLCNIYIMLPKEFELNNLYEICKNKKLIFKGMFLYSLNHYICLFYEKEIDKFVIYDDQLIKEYSSWKDILEKLIFGCYQPVLLIYEQYDKRNLKIEFNINEKFYDYIIKKSKENDEKKKSIQNPLKKIKEDEWECEFCNQYNNYNSEICVKCKKINENISFLLKSKFQIVNNINEKDLIEQKWTCPKCQCKTNLIVHPICSICNFNRNENNKVIVEKENNKMNKSKRRGKNKKRKKKEKNIIKIIEKEKEIINEKNLIVKNHIIKKNKLLILFLICFIIFCLSYIIMKMKEKN